MLSNLEASGSESWIRPPAERGLTQAQFEREYLYRPPATQGVCARLCGRLRRCCQPSRSCLATAVTSHLPVLSWLPAYDLRRDLAGDLIAGATVAVMHIPQGMAYALLASIPPIHGLYMAFFQCLVYAVFGTSRHLSVGTFAVICIMTGKVVLDHSTPPTISGNTDVTAAQEGSSSGYEGSTFSYEPIQVASTVALAVGLVELAMFVVRAGVLTVMLSDMLVHGFTTGAAVHVLCSQLASLLGLRLPRFSGVGKLPRLVGSVFSNIMSVNPWAVAISTITIFILVFNNQVIKPRVARRTRCPVPIELLVVVLGTAVSFWVDLSGSYSVAIIGNVTTGLPAPRSPDMELLPHVLLDSVVIAVVAYSISLSMAQLLARKHQYNVDANQELLAHGVSNVASSWFACAPMAASLSRSLIVDGAGGQTQAAGVFTSLLLLAVLLWLGPLFQLLPKCVLSAVIVVALRGLLRQVSDLPALWRASAADGFIWLATFAAVVGGDIDVGLAVGLAVSVVVLLWRLQRPPAHLMSAAPDGRPYYLQLDRYATAVPDPDIKIFRFEGALHFCNVSYFRSRLSALACVPTALASSRRQRRHTEEATRPEPPAAQSDRRRGDQSCQGNQKQETAAAAAAAAAPWGCPPRGAPRQSADSGLGAEHKAPAGARQASPGARQTPAGARRPPLPRRSSTSRREQRAAAEQQANATDKHHKSTTFPCNVCDLELAPLTADESDSDSSDVIKPSEMPPTRRHTESSHLVLDMSGVSFTDTTSTRALLALELECRAAHITCLLAGCNETVRGMLHSCGGELSEWQLYPGVHDAVLAARATRSTRSTHSALNDDS